jgi:serine/threonine-protein kinase
MHKELVPNTNLSHYRIVCKIGAGGMGEVYLAQDTKLDRRVAIKFLNEEFSRDVDKLKRFIQEAKAASALNHPNILTVYEIGEADGKNYIATELIDGKTLREHLSHKESLPLNTILKIGVQVAEALSAAHQAGIIHRDIKPENIMLRKDGYAKVLDFGLAKLSEPAAVATGSAGSEDVTRAQVNTTPGIVMGTVFYMSPEQARGKHTDARTDIWSLGVVLYEMLAKRVPFTGETVNHTIVSILEKEPLLLGNVPSELQRIVRKALTKDVEMRYQSARDLLIDLENLRRDLDVQGELERSVVPNREAATAAVNENETQVYAADSVGATRSGQAGRTQNVTSSSSSLEYAVTQAKSHKLTTAIVGLVLLGAISTVGYWFYSNRLALTDTKQIESIAVLPFQNASGNTDTEYLSEGISESLINSLTELQQLRVIARSTAFRYKGKEVDPQAVGRELNVRAVLMGRVRQMGDRLNIQVDLVDASTGAQLWGEEYERRGSDVLAVKQAIAQEVTQKLRLRLSGEQQRQLTRRDTTNAEAYQFYLRGRYFWNRRTADGLRKAIDEFQQSIDRDPTYALGYTGLADCYLLLEQYAGSPASETLPKAKAAATRALEIDDSLPEAHTSLAFYYSQSWQWDESEKEFKRAISLNPNYPTAHQWYQSYLRATGRFDEALAEIKRARELDPLSPILGVNLATVYIRKGDLDSALAEAKRLVELDPNFPLAHAPLGKVYIKQRKYSEAVAAFELDVGLDRTAFALSSLGYAYAIAGRRDEALAVLKELEDKYKRRESLGQYIALVFAGFGNVEQVFAWLEKDFKARSGLLDYLITDPLFDSIRGDPRYADLLRRMGLTR